MIRVVVADRQDTIREGVKSLLSKRFHATVCDVTNRPDLIRSIRTDEFDLAIIEPLMGGGTGQALIKQIKDVAPKTNVLVFTELDELKYGVNAIRNGAKGYLMKRCTSDELVLAADRVSQGKAYYSETLIDQVAIDIWNEQPMALHETLTERELQVFSMLVCGWNITNIASRLNLSVKTISSHKSRLLSKLACKSLSAAVEYAISQNLASDFRARCGLM